MSEHVIKPIAFIQSDFKEKFGIPRQSGRAPSLISKIIFEPEYRDSNALRGIEGFSHLWIIFDFSLAHKSGWSPTVRPPRLGGNEHVGVFASRSPFRPNNLGLSSVKLVEIEKSKEFGDVLVVSGADLLDGTPVYDIKPYLPFTDCHIDAIGGYADSVKDYQLDVVFPKNLKDLIPTEKIDGLIECLKDDPRPSYHNDEREYGMSFSQYEIKFVVKDKTLFVKDVQKK